MDLTLPILLLIPLLGAIVCALLPTGRAARAWALLVSLATLAVVVVMIARFQYSAPDDQTVRGARLAPTAPGTGLQFVFGPQAGKPWSLAIRPIGFNLRLGVDAISLWLVALTVFLMPPAILGSFQSIKERQREYYAWMLALLAAMLGVFVARDLLLFYVFFELTLIPMFFIIGIWGGPERRYAAAKFFLFTFAGSIFTLAAVIYLGLKAGPGGTPSFDLDDVVKYAQTLTGPEMSSVRLWVVLGLLAGFAVKVPLFPVHTWLPLAHTEAPTAGSVILAGVLLKLGTYGLLRLAVPIGLIGAGGVAFPDLIKFLGVICIIGIIYGALAAWVQKDIKKLVAYSSVSHLGFCVLGLLALNDAGMQGSVMYMVNHGLSTGALFLVVGMIYDRYHTRDIDALSGLAKRMPILAFFFVFFAFSSIGLPGLNGFVSEFLTVLGAFTSTYLGVGFGAAAALGVILGAVYMLHMVAKVIWGPLKEPTVEAHGEHDDAEERSAPLPADLTGREIGLLVPIALAVIFLGVQPRWLMEPMLNPLRKLQPTASLTLSPSTLGEGRGGGSAEHQRLSFAANPHLSPPPEYQGRGNDEDPSPQPSPLEYKGRGGQRQALP